MKVIDRHVCAVALRRWVGVLFLGTMLMMLGEFVGDGGMGLMARLIAAGKAELLAWWYLVRLPDFMLIWLPMSVLVAGMFTAGPMLRQGTLMMLSASGIPPRRVFASLLPLAMGVGLLAIALNDQVSPRLVPTMLRLEQEMAESKAMRKGVERPAAWRSQERFWCAQSADPESGVYRELMVFSDPRRGERVLAKVDRLSWSDGQEWRLEGVVLVQDDQQRRIAGGSAAELGLGIGYDRDQLASTLRPDRFKTSGELIAAGHQAWRIILHRLLQGLLPLLCICFALPRFVRWESRGNLGSTTIITLMHALLPIGGMAMASNLLASSPANPFLLAGGAATLLIGAGWLRWRMMRL